MSTGPGRVVVCGSLNEDQVFSVERIPIVGETTVASRVVRSAGGKGANQAYAAARSAPEVAVLMVGAVGDDASGALLCDELASAGVDVTNVLRSNTHPTGRAFIAVDAAGGNTIIVAAGANDHWPSERELPIRPGDVVVVQLEVPLDAVRAIVAEARRRGARVLLNAAPARSEARDLLALVDILVVNEVEATGMLNVDAANTAEIALLDLPFELVITRGSASTLVAPRGEPLAEIETIRARAIDTVGAGDAFVGAFAAALVQGADVVTAARRATAAGAATVTVGGARHPDLSPALLDALVQDHTSAPNPERGHP